MSYLQRNKILPLLFFITYYLLFPIKSIFAQVTLDPNNPGARPDPSLLKTQNITDVRIVLKNDEATINYVNSLKQAGINVIGIVNWEYDSDAWISGGAINDNYINYFANNVIGNAYSTFGQLKAYQIWNEPDGVAGTIGLTPESYAALLAAANNEFDKLNKNQAMISAGFGSGNLDYIKRMIDSLGGIFPADGVAYHPYIPDPGRAGSLAEVINGIKALYSLTGRPVWITEFGWETADEKAQAAWVGAVFSLLQNNETKSLLQTVMWYAYSDAQKPGFGLYKLDGTGKEALRQFLEIMLGHPISDELLEQLINVMMNVPKVGSQPILNSNPVCSINSLTPPTNTFPFRPNPCKNCSLNVPKPVFTCAQSPIVIQYKQFSCRDVITCPEDPNKYIAPLDWDTVIFNLNTKGLQNSNINGPAGDDATKVPFVGYKDVCRSTAEARGLDPKSCDLNTDVRSTNPNDYLNDYFEGSALFDQRYFDVSNPADMRDLWWEYGVYRKLTPLEAQDDQRIEMIKRGFNYIIKAKVKNADGNIVLKSRTLQEWATDMQPYDKRRSGNKGRLPPVLDISRCTDPNTYDGCVGSENSAYIENYQDWLLQDWGQLWYSIPFFSREDAPGKIILTIEHEPGTINEAATSYREEIPLSIPHLTRLYESTSKIYQILKPTMDQELAYDNQDTNISYQTNQLKPQTTPLLLAQAGISDSKEPKLLAQAQTQSCNGMRMIVENKGDSFAVHGFNTMPEVCMDPSDGMAHVEYVVDGTSIGSCTVYLTGSLYLPREDPNSDNPYNRYGMSIGDLQGCGVPITPSQLGSRQLTVKFWMEASHASDDASLGCTKAPSCNCPVGDPTCSANTKTQPTPVPCSNGSQIDGTCSGNNPKTDPQPNDEICCKSTAAVNVKSYIYSDSEIRPCSCRELAPGEEPPKDGIGNDNWAAVCDNNKTYTAKMSRQVEVKVDVPYLRDVLQKTSGPGIAIFNLFKPKDVGDFEEADALTNLTYEISSTAQSYLSFSGIDDNLINQTSLKGNLYLPYLGGIFDAKKCVSEVMLTPEDLRTGENWCRYKTKIN